MTNSSVADLGLDTRATLVMAGLMFTWALVLGAVKYRQMVGSPDGLAHPYTDIAHRAALLYSFALAMLAGFAELSAWSVPVNLCAVSALSFFFFTAVASYTTHGLRRDTENQLHRPSAALRVFMNLHVVGSLGGFLVLFAGYLAGAFA